VRVANLDFLGFGKYVRADKIHAVEPLVDDERVILTEMGVTPPRTRRSPQDENLF